MGQWVMGHIFHGSPWVLGHIEIGVGHVFVNSGSLGSYNLQILFSFFWRKYSSLATCQHLLSRISGRYYQLCLCIEFLFDSFKSTNHVKNAPKVLYRIQ